MSEKVSATANMVTRERAENMPSEPRWLKQERDAAFELYLRMPMPTSNDEDWRRTIVDSLDLSELTTIPFNHDKTIDSQSVPEWFETGIKHVENPAATIVLTSHGIWQTELSTDLTAKGVIFCDLQTALEKHPQLVQKYFDGDSSHEIPERLESKFGQMNKCMFNSGIFLYIPPALEIEQPFVSLTLIDNLTVSGASFPRILVVAKPQSKAKFVHVFASESLTNVESKTKESKKKLSFSNALVEIHAEDDSKFDYIELQNFANNVFAVTETYNVIARNAQFSQLCVGLGAAQLKGDIETAMQEPGARSDIQGLVLGDSDQHFSFNTIQEHNAPDTTSNINFKVALKGESTSIYQGIIRVAKVAQRTDALQTNKNLLLGAEARADSIPKLEILADDVKCSHGATVGPVDREQLFYLMTRGLNAQEAEELIVIGFFRQVLEGCTIPGVSKWVSALMTEKIMGATTQDS
jgi:Fe-S cluster assembly protein SufD